MATVLVENNIDGNVRGPLQPDVGNMLPRSNPFQNTVGGSTTTTGTGFVPPYPYARDATTHLRRRSWRKSDRTDRPRWRTALGPH
jgi:hypothetical protein